MNRYKLAAGAVTVTVLVSGLMYHFFGNTVGQGTAPLLNELGESSRMEVPPRVPPLVEASRLPEVPQLVPPTSENPIEEETIKVEEVKEEQTPKLPQERTTLTGTYPYGSFGYVWRNYLLDTANVEWWKDNEKYIKSVEEPYFVQSAEFKELYGQLMKESTQETGERLKNLCERYYQISDDRIARYNERADVWFFCRNNLIDDLLKKDIK